MKTFYLPDLGEGLPEGEIVKWHVKEGDFIKTDDPLVSIETAKAIVDVPSPYEGKILKFHGKEKDCIPTGGPLVDFEIAKKADTGTVAGEIHVGNEVVTEQAIQINVPSGNVKILPAVRALAKKLGVDITTIAPTGPNNTITAEDVHKASKAAPIAENVEPLHGTRRAMASAMVQAHAEVVPVTVSDDADISSWAQEKNYTVKVILAMIEACRAEPALNAWFFPKVPGRRLLSEVHIGLAMDTPDGLFVPVIHNAQTQSATQLRDTIEQLKKSVHARTIDAKQLHGASIVLSNFGKFAGRYANPIILPPTVAILGMGALREAILPVNGAPAVRTVLPLSLSFDHRAVTGGEATRFLETLMRHLQ